MTFVIVTPPPLKPSEPGVSGWSAAAMLRRLGVDARCIDSSIEWHRFVLERSRLESCLDSVTSGALEWPSGELRAAKQAIFTTTERRPLTRMATYRSRQVYTSAIRELELALKVAGAPFPRYKLAVAMVSLDPEADRLESTSVLTELAREPSPFDAYFTEELIPRLKREGATHVGVSLSFQQQAPAAFRLAQLLEERHPELIRVLGGPLVACWQAAKLDLEKPPFGLFHVLWDGTDHELNHLVSQLDVEASKDGDGPGGPLTGDLDEPPWDTYLSPRPIIPAALGRGCPWRRCSFCPDHLHPKHRPCELDELGRWLQLVADRFPEGAMLHLTDSALPPSYLSRIAEVIRHHHLPLRWHGFVRVDEAFADPEFARHLAEGGCATLQLGVESGSPRLLEKMHKGSSPDLAKKVLQSLGDAGIHNYVYLLFGLPGETDRDRELTLALIESRRDSIHAINPSLLNLPLQSPMHRRPERYGITELIPFHESTDLSLYVDFRCGDTHPRLEARRWLGSRFFKSDGVRQIVGHLRSPFKANHLCFFDE